MGWFSSFAAILVAALAIVAPTTAADPPRVTVIGDSVLTAVEWNATPRAILQQGLDVQLEIGVCRTLEGISCPYEGGNVPTLMDVVDQFGPQLGPVVVVEVGYNDPAAEFPQRVEDSIDALLAAGVQRILWVNMRQWQQQYIAMDQVLVDAAARHPELTIVDWESLSHDHYSWFQGDGVHLVYDGAVAMATLLNGAIKQALGPPPTIPATQLPVAYVGRPYSVRLAVVGGAAPYRWCVTSGPLPPGLHLLASGQLMGKPVRPGQLKLTLQAADSWGVTTVRRETLVIRG